MIQIPEGSMGRWRVERYTLSKEQAALENIRAPSRYIRPGTYTRLMVGDTLMMSDTPAEMRDHYEAKRQATGDVLIHGLGLGIVAQMCLDKDEVKHVTIIEIAPEVIELVAPTLSGAYGERLEIVCADALTWKPPRGKRYNCVWHDIWPYITPDNLPDMHLLHRRYGRRCDWQGSWARAECERRR